MAILILELYSAASPAYDLNSVGQKSVIAWVKKPTPQNLVEGVEMDCEDDAIGFQKFRKNSDNVDVTVRAFERYDMSWQGTQYMYLMLCGCRQNTYTVVKLVGYGKLAEELLQNLH